MIFVAGDRAIYEGMSIGSAEHWAGVLVRGQLVTVVWPNEDEDDEVIVRKSDCTIEYHVSADQLAWRPA